MKSILIVEDDRSILEALEELLMGEGYQVRSAANGQKALEFLRTIGELPNVILLDLMMPVMDGFQFRQSIQQEPRLSQIPIIIMSAGGDIESKRLRIGARSAIKKPFEIEQVLSSLDQFFSMLINHQGQGNSLPQP